MDIEQINTIAQWVGYAAMAAAVIPHPHAKTLGGVLKGIRMLLDVAAVNVGQAKNEKNPIKVPDKGNILQ